MITVSLITDGTFAATSGCYHQNCPPAFPGPVSEAN